MVVANEVGQYSELEWYFEVEAQGVSVWCLDLWVCFPYNPLFELCFVFVL